LRNGLIPGQLLNSKSEETAVNQIMQESNFTETPLFVELICNPK
jgi:hypothetical protein